MNIKSMFSKLDQESLFHGAKGMAFAAGGMVIVLAVLLIAQFFQVRAVDPIDSKPLQIMMERIKDNPQDAALRDQIRALDLLARKAYFTSQWQLRTGGIMLIGAVLLLLTGLKIMRNIHKKLPHPEGCADYSDHWLIVGRARRWITICGIVLISSSLVAAVITHGDMNGSAQAKVKTASAEDFMNNWANFRGPGGNGIANTNKAPTNWDVASGEGVKWKIAPPLPGYSSPVIWKDRVYITGADDKSQQLYAYDAGNGELVWTHDVNDVEGSPASAPDIHSDTGYAPSSAATDGAHICAVYPTGDLVCVDADGKRLWAQNLGKADNHYGHSSSLIIHRNILIVQWDQNRSSKLLGLDLHTGETIWRSPRTVISWSSPIIVNTGGRYELILTNSQSMDSFDPMTGTKLWGQNVLGGEMGPSAAYADGRVFGANDYAVVAGLKITPTGAEMIWEYDENMPDTASPLATKDHLFIFCSYGVAVCLDAKTGEAIWEHEYDDGFYGSPILVGDYIYVTDLQGTTYIIKAAADYEEIAALKLGETSACTPAAVNGRLYHRGEKFLYCFE
ncbi:PQQ-like beta-propeller repeat protein [bacterium]|nr:PQQ-like beta-propeller repeat protein [bacterium]